MTGEVIARIETLRAHASSTAGIAGNVRNASDSGGALSPSAFGLLCSFFVAPSTALQNVFTESVNAEADAIEAMGTAVRECGNDYDTADTEVADRLQALGQQI